MSSAHEPDSVEAASRKVSRAQTFLTIWTLIAILAVLVTSLGVARGLMSFRAGDTGWGVFFAVIGVISIGVAFVSGYRAGKAGIARREAIKERDRAVAVASKMVED